MSKGTTDGFTPPSGMSRRELHRWFVQRGASCTEHWVRKYIQEAGYDTGRGPRGVKVERELDDLTGSMEDGVSDGAARVATAAEEALFKPEIPEGAVWAGSTIQTKSADGSDRWHRIKPAPESLVLPDGELNEFRERLLSTSFVRDVHRSKPVSGGPVAFAVAQSDAQLGKPGTSEAVDNWTNGVDMAVDEAARLIDNGVNIIKVISLNGGDPIEGLFSYSNQAWLLELGLVDQIDLAIDTRLSALLRLSGLGLPMEDWTFESNHGEASRAGEAKKIVTTTADSHDILISRQVAKLAAKTPELADVEFVYPERDERDQLEWFVYRDVCGVGVYASHGHREHGKGTFQEAKALNGVQRVGWAYRDRMYAMRVALLSHFHHHYIQQNADLAVIGNPALEAYKSSGYLLSGGIYSQPGVLSVLLGEGAGVQGYARPMVHTPVRLPMAA